MVIGRFLPYLLFLVPAGLVQAQTFTVFGPTTYVRAGGKPVQVLSQFSVAAPTEIATLRILNGGDPVSGPTGPRVSSAEILLNGVVVAGPDDFSQNVESIIKTVATIFGINEHRFTPPTHVPEMSLPYVISPHCRYLGKSPFIPVHEIVYRPYGWDRGLITPRILGGKDP